MDTLLLVSPEQVGLSAARLARVSKWMKGWVDSGKLPGMTVAVMRKGELAFAETYGKADVERDKPMRPDTIVRIYSMTKPLTDGDHALRGGPLSARRPDLEIHPRLQGPARLCRRLARQDRIGAGGTLHLLPRPARHSGADLRLHGEQPGRRADRAKGADGVDYGTAETSLREVTGELATFPLIAQPGKAWNYSWLLVDEDRALAGGRELGGGDEARETRADDDCVGPAACARCAHCR